MIILEAVDYLRGNRLIQRQRIILEATNYLKGSGLSERQ